MKVALSTFAFPEFTVSLAQGLQQFCETVVFVPEGCTITTTGDVDIRRFRYRPDSSPFDKLRACGALAIDIRKLQPDLLHLQGSSPYLLPFLPLLASFPIIKTLHDPVAHSGEQRWSNTLSKLLVTAQAERVIVMAEAMRQSAVATRPWLRNKLDVIPHGIYDCYRDGPQSRPQWLPDGTQFILFFGRISPYKGVEDLLEAFQLVSPKYAGKLVIAGKQLYSFHIPREIKSKVIAVNEYISNDVLRYLFRNCDSVVLPYRDATQSGVLMLAYAFGRPVIATTVGGFPEMIRHHETGVLVQPRLPQALAEGLIELIANRSQAEIMGSEGRRWAEETFSWHKIANRTFNVYETVLFSVQSKVAPRQIHESSTSI